MCDASECDGILILNGHFEIIPGLKVELIPNGSRQDDLAFLG